MQKPEGTRGLRIFSATLTGKLDPKGIGEPLWDFMLCCNMICFPCGSAGEESLCNVGDLGSIPGLGRSPRKGNRYPLQYADLENSHELYSPWGCKESDTAKRLSLVL